MDRYNGIFSYTAYLFTNYSILSDSHNALTLSIGSLGVLAGLLMLYRKDLRVHRSMLLIIAVLSIVTGLLGSVATIRGTTEALSVEQKRDIVPTADKYYSLEYGYAKILLWLFPVSVGIFAAIPSLLILYKLNKAAKSRLDLERKIH
jgi:uncharacterized membrane protein YozB (DUF420 family)